jgi:hypothetical protein
MVNHLETHVWRSAGFMGLLAGCGIISGILLTAAETQEPATHAVEIGIKGRANANASLATNGAFVGVAWSARTEGGVTDIYATISRDNGRSFRAPVRVNRVAGEASVSGEQPPRIALMPGPKGDPSIAVVWTTKGSEGTRLVSARSSDGGASFTAAEPVPGSEAPGNRGWESIATTAKGEVVTLWLDHRDGAARTSAAPASGAHQHGAGGHQAGDGVARAQLSRLYFAKLNEPDSSRGLVNGVCYCCKTSLATDADGGIYAAWRHVYPGNVRDIAFSRSPDGGRTFAPPVRVSEDNWVLDGCPENGPALIVDDAKSIHVVWPTLVPNATAGGEPTLGLFYARSTDGHQFSQRQRIPTEGVPRHPQIAITSKGEIIVAWDEQAEGGRRVALARASLDGKSTPRFVREPLDGGGPGVYPVIAPIDQGAIIAWTGGSGADTRLHVERLSVR